MKRIISLTLLIIIGAMCFLYVPSAECSSELSRNKAAKMLEQTGTVLTATFRCFNDDPDTQEKCETNFINGKASVAPLQKLQDEGFLEIISFDSLGEPQVTLSEKSRMYIIDRKYIKGMLNNFVVLLGTIKKVKVTGIQKIDSNMVKVDYITTYKATTPFGKVLLGEDKLTQPGSKYFNRYDDGWRLQK